MYRILCFGDSNTWGFNPKNGLRYLKDERWPGVLQQSLGDGFKILEDGLNGRRVFGSYDEFSAALEHNDPLDVVIIYLGVNDLLFEKDISVKKLVEGAARMIENAREFCRGTHGIRPEIILISAAPINETQVGDLLYEIEAEKVLRFGTELRKLSEAEGCGFIDSGRIVHSSEEDGVHLEVSEHKKLGLFIADYVRTYLLNGNLTNNKH